MVDELHRCIVARRGLFAKGKFDLLSRDTSCLLGAFRTLVVQLMVTDAEQWKARILRALSPNAQVLCDVVPELTRLLGEQPPVPILGTAETANRLNMCFLQFVGCLATSSSPLVLFVDDLQWVRSDTTAKARPMKRKCASHPTDCAMLLYGLVTAVAESSGRERIAVAAGDVAEPGGGQFTHHRRLP